MKNFTYFNNQSRTSTARMRHAFSDTSGHKTFLKEKQTWLANIKSKGFIIIESVLCER